MKKSCFKKLLCFILCAVLIAATALCITGCDKKEKPSDYATQSYEGGNIGTGSTVFDLTVTDDEGKEKAFKVHTDKKTVGEALLELAFIAGDEGQYGLYIKNVNGCFVDYDESGKYWAFYIDGEYAMSGVDQTQIEQGKTYSFKVEK